MAMSYSFFQYFILIPELEKVKAHLQINHIYGSSVYMHGVRSDGDTRSFFRIITVPLSQEVKFANWLYFVHFQSYSDLKLALE